MAVKLDKQCLSSDQMSIIRKLLYLEPKTEYMGFAKQNPYAVVKKDPILFYMESKNTILLPYAFANKLLSKNTNQSFTFPLSTFSFTSTLRPEQLTVTEQALEKLLTNGSVILGCYPGFGKCLGKNTFIRMFNGTSKCVTDIKIGDQLQGDDNIPRTVLSTCKGIDTMYKITTPMETFWVNSCHILTLFDGQNIIDIDISTYLSLHTNYKSIYLPIDYPSNNIDTTLAYNLGKKYTDTIDPNIQINTFNVRRAFIQGVIDANNIVNIDKLTILANSIGCRLYKKDKIICTDTVGQPIYVDFSIEKGLDDEYYGFTIDGNGRFLLDSYLVTHNTVVSSFLGSKVDGIVLVLYHRLILGEQWRTTFETFTDAVVWMVDGSGNVPSGCNVILTMNTMIFNIPPEILKMVKCLIIDEAHAFCVPSCVSCLLATQPAYVIACSATLDTRRDGLQDMMYALCGQNMVVRESTKPFDVYQVMTGITVELTKNRAGVTNWSQVIKDLTGNEQRNKYIIDLIVKNPEHKIIVLTWSKAHVGYLYDKLLEKGVDVEFLCGNKKKYNDSAVLLGTISKIGTGFDEATSCQNFKGIKSNMMIICGSVKNQGGLEQFVGRVFRSDFPTIFHLVDNDRIAKSHWRSCEKWYLSRNGKIIQLFISTDQNEINTLTDSRTVLDSNNLPCKIKDTQPTPSEHLKRVRQELGLL